MKMEPPQPESPSRGWFVLKKAKRYLLKKFNLIYKKISTLAPTTASAAMNSDLEPPQNKSTKNPPPPPSSPSFSSLPDEIVINCLARISKSYYPTLCLVSKSFRSLILSKELSHARFDLKTAEDVLRVCLQFPDRRFPTWFSLWIKPNQTLTNNIEDDKKSTGNTLLVRVPSSHSPRIPTMFICKVGSKIYAVRQYNNPPTSSLMWIGNERIYANEMNYDWCKAPNMTVARENAVAGMLDGKLYVMGGCKADETTNWAEVFDTKTQTWESLPDPGAELRFSFIKTLNVIQGKVYVSCMENTDYVYDPEDGSWSIAEKAFMDERRCSINDVWYSFGQTGCFWYDTKRQEWRLVKGLNVVNKICGDGIITLDNYEGKLVILWDKINKSEKKNIWCSVIRVETREDEVWGNVEWASVVLKVPSSYVFIRCEVRTG